MELHNIWQKAVLNHSPRCRGFKAALDLHCANLRLIWQIYTQERRHLGRLPFTDARLVGPYLLGFHLPNVARFQGLLTRALKRGLQLPTGDGPVRVIDLGAGTGAGAQGVFLSLKEKIPASQFEFELVDRSRHLVQSAAAMVEELALGAKVRTLAKALHDDQTDHLLAKWFHRPARLNIICLGYVWNELSPNPRLRGHLLETLNAWSQCETPTWLLITEPAAEASARQAMRLRQSLIQMDWQVMYPCLKTDACPMGLDGRDWCYSEMDFKKSREQLEVEKILGVSRATLGSAAYLFVNGPAAKSPARPQAPSPLPSKRTVVGRPKRPEGGQELLLCDGSQLGRQTSQASPARGELA